MFDPNAYRNLRDNPAWRRAREWRAGSGVGRRPEGAADWLRATFTWLAVSVLLMVGMVMALLLFTLGLLMLPFLRYRLRKQAERQGQVWPGEQSARQPRDGPRVIEGEYQVKRPPSR